MNLFLPEHCKLVDATRGPVLTFADVTCDYVSLKDTIMAWIVLQFTQAEGHETWIEPQVATSVLPTGATNITFAADIWSNEDTAATDTLVKRTSATSYYVVGDVAKKMVVIRIDPSKVVAQGVDYDCLGCVVSSSKTLENIVSGIYVLQQRMPQATPRTVLLD